MCISSCCRCGLRAVRARAVRDVSGAAAAESLSLYVFLRSGRLRRRRLLARSAGEVFEGSGPDATDRGKRRAALTRRTMRVSRRAARRSEENAEHVMLVDLARNDLGRVAQAGSVDVHPYRHIERYSHVMHIVSGVNGALAAGRMRSICSRRRSLPARSSGAESSRDGIIDELEPCDVDSMAARWLLRHGGDMDQAITIRTMVFRGDTYSFQAGAGIVADSVPAPNIRKCSRRAPSCAARSRWRRRGYERPVLETAPAADR